MWRRSRSPSETTGARAIEIEGKGLAALMRGVDHPRRGARRNRDLREAQEKASADREQYRALYMQLLERCRLLELGLVAGKKAERFGGEDEKQLSMQLLGMLLAEGEAPTEEVDEAADGDDDVGDLKADEDDETEPGDAQLADLAEPLVDAMMVDAFRAPYLCVDATGVLVQAKEQCQRSHFFVMVAPERHVIYRYSPKHDSSAVDRLLAGYKGYLVADGEGAEVVDRPGYSRQGARRRQGLRLQQRRRRSERRRPLPAVLGLGLALVKRRS